MKTYMNQCDTFPYPHSAQPIQFGYFAQILAMSGNIVELIITLIGNTLGLVSVSSIKALKLKKMMGILLFKQGYPERCHNHCLYF